MTLPSNTFNSVSKKPPLSVLVEAARHGTVKTVKGLLEAGIHPDEKDYGGSTALIVASRKGHMEIVRLLIASGADLNAKNKSGRSALNWAVEHNRVEVAQLLARAGAALDEKNRAGKNVQDLARSRGRTEIVNLFKKETLCRQQRAIKEAEEFEAGLKKARALKQDMLAPRVLRVDKI